jgi:AcrR family transcriptional regulator
MICARRDGRCAGRADADRAAAARGVRALIAAGFRSFLLKTTRQHLTARHDEGVSARQPAHRPSRRDEIVDAAIAVFAQRGYVDTAISHVAEAADVAVTAVYYHFAGKDDLYGAAIAKVLSSVDEVVATVRPDDAPAETDTLFKVIDAVWEWVDDNPEPAKLMHLHTPTATRQAAALRREFDDLHVRRAFAYLADDPTELTKARMGAANLAVRTLVDMLIAIHPMRMPGGPLHGCSPKALRAAVKDMAARLVLTV